MTRYETEHFLNQHCPKEWINGEELAVADYVRFLEQAILHIQVAGWITARIDEIWFTRDATRKHEIIRKIGYCIAFINAINERAGTTPPLIDTTPLKKLAETLGTIPEGTETITRGEYPPYESVKKTLVRLDEITTLIRRVSSKKREPLPLASWSIGNFFSDGGNELIAALDAGVPIEEIFPAE